MFYLNVERRIFEGLEEFVILHGNVIGFYLAPLLRCDDVTQVDVLETFALTNFSV
jgi:hypothetical protein